MKRGEVERRTLNVQRRTLKGGPRSESYFLGPGSGPGSALRGCSLRGAVFLARKNVLTGCEGCGIRRAVVSEDALTRASGVSFEGMCVVRVVEVAKPF